MYLTLAPFDTTTEEGRSKERYRRVALSTAASACAKAILVFTTLITVPLTVDYLGTERYGLWMTISSTIAMLGFGDLGIGLGMLNVVSEADGKRDRQAALGYVSSGFFMLLGIAVFLIIFFTVAYRHIPWARLFNVSTELAAKESGLGAAVFFSCFALNVPLWAVNRVRLGYQEGYVNSLWEMVGNVAGLGGVLLAIYMRAGLPWLILAMSGAPALASLINGVRLFRVERPWLLPKWKAASRDSATRIFKLGFLFFILQIMGAIAYSSDNIIAAQILGADSVAQYSVPMKMFSVIPMMLGWMLIPLWPAYGEAIANGDPGWVKRTLSRSTAVSALVSVPASALLVLLGGRFIHFWVGPAIDPSLPLLLGIGVWTAMSSTWGAVVMFLNGANAVRQQVLCASVMGGFALVLKIVMARSVGLPGIVWGTVIAQAMFMVVPMSLYARKLISSMSRNAAVAEGL